MKRQKPHVTLDVIREFNRCCVWPQRRINRLIRKYDEYMIQRVKGL